MPKYFITALYTQPCSAYIEADSPEEAVEKVKENPSVLEKDIGEFEYIEVAGEEGDD